MATFGLATFTAGDGTGISAYTADLGFGAFSPGISASQVFIQGNEVVTSNAGVTIAAVSQDLLGTDDVEAFMDVRREDADVSGAVFGLSFRRKNSGNTSNGEGLAFLVERVSAANVTLVVRQYNAAGTEIFSSIIATPFAWALGAYKRIGVRLQGSTVIPFVEAVGGGGRQSFSGIVLAAPYSTADYGRYGLITRRHTGQRFDNLTLTDIPKASNPGTAAGGAPQTVNFPRPLPRYDLENENRFRRTLQAALNEVAAKAGTLDLTTTVAAHSHLANQIGGVTVAERTFKESALYTFTDSLDIGGVVHSGTLILPSGNNVLDVGSSARRLKKLWAVDIDFSGVLTGTIQETQIADGAILARVAANETISGTWTFSQPILAADGALSAPSYSFASDPGAGMHLAGGTQLGFAVGGLTRMQLSAGALGLLTPTQLNLSAAGLFVIAKTGGELRLSVVSADPLTFYTTNTARWRMEAAGHLIPAIDNAYDMGADATRPRNLYLRGAADIAGSVVVDTIAERTAAAGVTIDGLLIKDAGIPQAAVTAHQAALSIAETQIPDGSILARVGSAETISGAWTYTNRVTIQSADLQLGTTVGATGARAINIGTSGVPSDAGTVSFWHIVARGSAHPTEPDQLRVFFRSTTGSFRLVWVVDPAEGQHWYTNFIERLQLTKDGRLFGTALHNNPGSVTGTTNQYIASGTYTPTLTNVANLDASTAYACQWTRVGNVVTVSGKVDADPALTATATQLGISLPIASALAAANQCGGAAAAPGIAGQSAAIIGDATNDRAEMRWVSGDVTNQAMFFTFTYVIL